MAPSSSRTAARDPESYCGAQALCRDGTAPSMKIFDLGRRQKTRCFVLRHEVRLSGALAADKSLTAHALFATPDKRDVDDLTQEFIAESRDGLDRMERCLTDLETRPQESQQLVAEIFRAVHTIKGTTGFLGFSRLEKLAHAGEHLLGSLREESWLSARS